MAKIKKSDGKTSYSQSEQVCKNWEKASKSKSASTLRTGGKTNAKRFLHLGGKAKYLPRRPSVCRWMNLFVLPGFHFEAKVLGRDDKRGS